MASAQERIVDLLEKQQPNKAEHMLMVMGAGATLFTIFSAIDVIVGWIGG